MNEAAMIRVAVAGAAGRMGREVVRAVAEAQDMRLVAAVDHTHAGSDVGDLAGLAPLEVFLETDLAAALARTQPDVMVDFTTPQSVLGNMRLALSAQVAPVVGTSGLQPEDIEQVRREAEQAGIGGLIAANFAIGAVLMMQFAEQAARYLPDVEIIEMHHEQKRDAPSFTALQTARKIAAVRQIPSTSSDGLDNPVSGARGITVDGIHIHSVRLPGLVAHQAVLFGGLGQTLTLRHDSSDRRSFMPGVLLAIRKVRTLSGLVIGLENLL